MKLRHPLLSLLSALPLGLDASAHAHAHALPRPDQGIPGWLVPEPDCKRFAEFGQQIQKIFSSCIASANGDGKELTMTIPHDKAINMISIMEDIKFGERVRKYKVEALCEGKLGKIAGGTCIGHKRVERIAAVKASELRLTVAECAWSNGTPRCPVDTCDSSPNMFSTMWTTWSSLESGRLRQNRNDRMDAERVGYQI